MNICIGLTPTPCSSRHARALRPLRAGAAALPRRDGHGAFRPRDGAAALPQRRARNAILLRRLVEYFVYFSRQRFRETPHSTNETGATNCYTYRRQKRKKHADRQTRKLGRGYLWGSFLIAAAALKTPTRNCYNAQGGNLNFSVVNTWIPCGVSECLLPQPGSQLSLYKILFHFKPLLFESIILNCPSPPPAKATLLQHYCTTIAQYTPAHRPPLFMRVPYNIGDGNIVSRSIRSTPQRAPMRPIRNPYAIWPLHDIAITNIVQCIAYTGGVGGASYLAQQTCNSIAIVRAMQVGGGKKRRIVSHIKLQSETISCKGYAMGTHRGQP